MARFLSIMILDWIEIEGKIRGGLGVRDVSQLYNVPYDVLLKKASGEGWIDAIEEQIKQKRDKLIRSIEDNQKNADMLNMSIRKILINEGESESTGRLILNSITVQETKACYSLIKDLNKFNKDTVAMLEELNSK
jgi:hypothetical protein